MAEVLGVISGLYTAGQALHTFALQIKQWRLLSERLLDIKEGLEFAKLSLDSWQYKYDIQIHRPDIHTRILFGKEGHERITATIGAINIITRSIKSDISRVRGLPLKVQSKRAYYGEKHNISNEERVKECLRKIQSNNTWSRRFVLSVLGKADDLEMRLKRLHQKLTMLERFSDFFLEKEHADIFSEIKRLPGRRVIIKVGDGRTETIQSRVLDAVRAQKDAERLHRCSAPSQQNGIHIGISVPRVHKRDFAFLLSMNGTSYEVLVQPVTIRAVHDPSMVPKNLATAVSTLAKKKQDNCYMVPSLSTSAGFIVQNPPTNLLSALEYKEPLSTAIRDQNVYLSSQKLYSQDQNAIATGIAQGCFRLIGSQWLSFLDCSNIRWRRTKDGNWASMLAAAPGQSSTTRTLEQCYKVNRQRRDSRDLSKHIQIFRIGLVLAEIALKAPFSYIDFDTTTHKTKLYINDGEEVSAHDVASQVDMKSNILLGNMVFFCLNVLQDNHVMDERSIDGGYFQDVLKQAEELERILGADRRRGGLIPGSSTMGSGSNTPRSAGSAYVY
ncbi:uncharacterized protein ALTATR162_LOCUS2114 [Alternaria atra]|uniref:Uncharacterized protein n=1 Tax=Alternaria atra TaxID=119953 RepID=A0A8J2HXD8_9PLEO|nr:uncharacterized protein ALTATR162_LOCUS2114 [Alternaria atra]CAG5147901.1 unnamed protein product [Alternaria atra]